MNKDEIRKLYVQKRRELKLHEADLFSRKILEQFKNIALVGVNYLHIFYPIPGRVEVDTLLIKEYIRQNYPQIKLVLCKSSLKENTLSHYVWDENTRLCMNTWGITEPEGGEEIHPEALDIILIPLLAFDIARNRVGYGKGFYDRFLIQCRPEALKIGLSFFTPTAELIEAGEHDVPLNACITPTEIYRF